MKTYFTTITEVLHQNVLDKKTTTKTTLATEEKDSVIVKDASGYERSWFVYVCVSVFIIYFDLLFFFLCRV